MTRAPTEFRYWDRLERPAHRWMRRASRALGGFDLAPPDDVVRAFADMYYDADPLAEAFVRDVYLTRGMAAGRAMLEDALTNGAGPEAPPSLRALFADIDEDPPWLDRDRLERGARVFRRWGTSVFRFAGAVTLAAYSESSVAKPLALTGAYAGASTKHRFLETAAFWIAVSEPGGMRPGGAGRASALRVRMMHVFVRDRLLAHPDWDLEAWGVPISQADALLTLMGGSVAPGIALRAMGYRPSRADIEATMHFWRYVGHVMGVRPRWYPASVEEALQLAFVTHVKSARTAGEDGVRLCQSWVDAFAAGEDATLRSRLSDGVHRGFTRAFLPPAAYAANRLPPAGPWALLPFACFPFIFGAETLRRALPPLEHVADRAARWRRRRWLAHHTGGRPPEYAPRDPTATRARA
ncbi:MAG: oxygenase MpaB family protein [Sandaracinaceae bacterium]